MSELGKNIKELRTKLGLRQNDLASVLNISPQAISKWENGENAPDISLIPSIAKYLGTTIDNLFGYCPQENQTIKATVMVTNICSFYEKSKGLDLKDAFNMVNAHYYQITETILKYNGIPVKYFGNEILCFFTGDNHIKRAIEAAFNIVKVTSERMSTGIGSGDIYLGKLGHPDYAEADIIGDPVSEAYHANMWSKKNASSGIGATKSVIIEFEDELNMREYEENGMYFYEIIDFKNI